MNRVIAIELISPGSVQTLMIAKMYGLKGWGCFSAKIEALPSVPMVDTHPLSIDSVGSGGRVIDHVRHNLSLPVRQALIYG